jgi:23S rRNA (adenine-N6)-dimethyltransferase
VAERAWGWHPLTEAWAARIVDDAAVRPGELVLDLGAGNGALTRHLVAAGARVLAVEMHPGRAQRLRDRFAGTPVRILESDICSLRLPRRPFRVVANPPYQVTTALLRLLLAHNSALVAADLVLQRAAVRAIVAGRGSARWWLRWSLVEGRPLPRSAFTRPSTVDSRMLVIRRLSKFC